MNWAALALAVLMAGGADMPEPPRESSYLACGCGCCGGVQPQEKCVEEDALALLIEKDKAQAASPQCAVIGCSVGVEYTVCE